MNFADEYETFYTSVQGAHAALQRDGVAVIAGVLSPDEIESARSGMYDCLETLTANMGSQRIDRNVEASIDVKPLLPLHSMLLQHYGIGQSQFVWDIRGCSAVQEVFAALWACRKQDLITSFDGVSIHVPHERTGRGHYRGDKHDWFHTDQASTRPQLDSIQGLVNLWDVDAGDATLRVLKGSNAYHSDFFQAFGIRATANWYKLNGQEHTQFFLDRGCSKACVLAKAGDLVLWDSRTMHAGCESRIGRPVPKMRCAVYVCMVPRCKASTAVQKRRLEDIFKKGRMTGHSPHRPVMFGKLPRLYPGMVAPNVCPLPPAQLSAAAKALI